MLKSVSSYFDTFGYVIESREYHIKKNSNANHHYSMYKCSFVSALYSWVVGGFYFAFQYSNITKK